MSPPILQIKNLQIDFSNELGTTTAVHHLSLEVHPSEILAIVGESGSGKSVTALSILQLLPTPPASYPTGEIIFFDGKQTKNLLQCSHRQLQQVRGKDIAMIFQEPMTSLNPVFTCGEQVMEAIWQHEKVSHTVARELTLALFEKVHLPDPANLFHRYPHQLSGGQKQRVMIAMAMSCNPLLLICDEPTTALDVTVQKTILDLIAELQEKTNMSVIFITHDLGVVATIAHRVAVMYKGEIVEQGTREQVFNSPQHPYTRGLLACRPLLYPRGKRLPVVADFLEQDSFPIYPALPEKTTYSIPAKDPQHHPVLVDVQHLSVWFPEKKSLFGKVSSYTKAVDDISFQIMKDETLGIVGESGCGKTTLGRTLLKLLEPAMGHIFYDGIDLSMINKKTLKQFRKNIQLIFQDPYSSLNPRMTIGAAIEEPLMVHGIENAVLQRKKRVLSLLEKVNLQPGHYNRYPHEFSGGQRQRIVIARALALSPSFLVCDESVSALDVSVQAQVLNLLNDLKKEYGFTIVFISHDLSVVRYISDRILVMNRGKIEEIGAADDVYFRPQSLYTKKLIASIPSSK